MSRLFAEALAHMLEYRLRTRAGFCQTRYAADVKEKYLAPGPAIFWAAHIHSICQGANGCRSFAKVASFCRGKAIFLPEALRLRCRWYEANERFDHEDLPITSPPSFLPEVLICSDLPHQSGMLAILFSMESRYKAGMLFIYSKQKRIHVSTISPSCSGTPSLRSPDAHKRCSLSRIALQRLLPHLERLDSSASFAVTSATCNCLTPATVSRAQGLRNYPTALLQLPIGHQRRI